MVRALATAFLFALSLAAQDPTLTDDKIPKENPFTTPADVKRGQHLFQGHCAPCHGPAGEGSRGPSLARPRLPRAPDEQSLFKLLRNGIEGTEMPGAWVMIDKEIWQTAAFVRTLGRTAVESLPGDRARGEAVFRGKGKCAGCHSVTGQGGRTGPDLTEVGTRRSASYLRRKLVDPTGDLPEGFLQVTVATKEGRRITGIRLNEDTYSLQLRDLSDRPHSFWKTDLKQIQKDWGKTPMPGYRGVLTDSEMEDVVAYLASLRGVS
ncbi:MAG: c-type cytochrome [Acidobacteria bacterium]|nr:c-type cytochrome [Acidobacteriota bacterium]